MLTRNINRNKTLFQKTKKVIKQIYMLNLKIIKQNEDKKYSLKLF